MDRLSKKSAKNDAQIKHQNNQIVELMEKLEKKSSKASNKGSGTKDSNEEYNHNEESDDELRQRRIAL